MAIIMAQPVGGEGSGKFNKVDIPSGMYPATLIALETGEQPSFDDKTKMEPCIYWTFEVCGKNSSVEIITNTSMSFNSGITYGKESKAHKWTQAMLGELPPDGFDLELLLKKPCLAMVERKISKKDGSPYSVITNVLAPQGDVGF